MTSVWKAGLLVCVAAVAVACGGGGGGNGGVTKPRIRFVNASVDSTALTFKVNGDVDATGVVYPGLSTEFIEKTQDSYDLAVREDGGTDEFDSMATNFLNNKEYLVAAVGLENWGTESLKRLRIVAPEIDLTAPNGSGKARIYVLHAFIRQAGFDTPDIDFRNTDDNNPQYQVTGIGFGEIGTLTIDASNQTFFVRRNGTESDYVSQNFTFVGGGIYVAIVCGIEGQVGAQAPKIQFIKLN